MQTDPTQAIINRLVDEAFQEVADETKAAEQEKPADESELDQIVKNII